MKNSALDHARHNEIVCEYLDQPKDKHDWVVTTAFYSALHYVRYRIFPFEMEIRPDKKEEFKDFDEYFHYYHSIYPDVNKHEALKKLVRVKLPKIADDYDQLLSICSTARYVDYNLDKQFSKSARKSLKLIKEICETKEKGK